MEEKMIEEQKMTNEPLYIKKKTKQRHIEDIYEQALLTRTIHIPIINIGKNFRQVLELSLKNEYEAKCAIEGFIKKNSIEMISYSSGIVKGVNIMFEVVFKCLVAFPVENMIINCVVKNITKAGIKAESINEDPSPFIMFISRDHHYNNTYFNTLKIDNKIKVKIIGQRFELNDKFISIIGELMTLKYGETI